MKIGDYITKFLPHFTPLALLGIPIFVDMLAVKVIVDKFDISFALDFAIYVIVYLVVFIILITISLHIPKGRKGKFNVCLVFVTSNINDDTKIVKQNIISSFEAVAQNIDDIYVTTPNLLSRYFFNYWCFNHPFLNKYKNLLLKILVKVSRSDLILFGQIEPIMHKGKQHNNVKINTYLPAYNKKIDVYLKQINNSINKTAFYYDADNEIVGLEKVVRFMETCSKLYLALYYSENARALDALNMLINVYDIVELDAFDIDNKSVFQKSLRCITNYFFVEISYSNKIAIEILIKLCERFLAIFPDDTDVLLTYQYYKMLKLRQECSSYTDYKTAIKNMLNCCNRISYIDENHVAILANKAYLNLLNLNYDLSIALYDELFLLQDNSSRNVMCEIFTYYRDTDENSFEYEYAKFAYAYYNYKKNTSPNAKTIAKSVFTYLVNEGTDEFIINKSNEYLNCLNVLNQAA